MHRSIFRLVFLTAVGGAAALLVSNDPASYLTLQRNQESSAARPSQTRDIMKNVRNTRSIPINADVAIWRIAPGSSQGPVDLHHRPWDWVEVINRSHAPLPMAGYSLSDDPGQVRKFRFPDLVLPPQSACRVWLCGFSSMNSVWSLTPTDAVGASGWRATRRDALADRFTYMWCGDVAPPNRQPQDPDAFLLVWPVNIDEPGRYALWLQAGVNKGARCRLLVRFEGRDVPMTIEKSDALALLPVQCPSTPDGYWELPAGVHDLSCAVLQGSPLVNHLAVLRYGEPFGTGRQDLHAGFKLKQSGEFIGLFDPKGVAVDHVDTPALPTGMMATRNPDGGGRLRIESVQNLGGRVLPPPRFDVPPGVVATGTTVHLACHDPNADIRYTRDGAMPTRGSRRFDQGVSLASNTVIRARVFDESGRGGPVAEASYWTEPVVDLPILSVIAEPEHLYDYSHGILYNTTIRGPPGERRCHLTLIDTNGSATALGGGMRIQGRSSRTTESKRNFRFRFRERHGQPVWPGALFAGEGPTRCRSVVAIGRNMIRNELAHELMDLAFVRGPRRRQVRLFANGEPFGLYLLMEDVQDPAYLEQTFGHLDLDVIKEKTHKPVKWGSQAAFNREVLPWVTRDGNSGMTYEVLSSLFDIRELTHWWAVVMFAGIDDTGQGYYVRDNRASGPPWTLINWDLDNAFLIAMDQGWAAPQGYRTRLFLPVKNSSPEFQKEEFFPALQHMFNHVMPLARLPERARELMALYDRYLDEEFEAHLNQRVFRSEVPERESFLDLVYRDSWKQLLSFVDHRMQSIPTRMGDALFGGPVCKVVIEAGALSRDLMIDAWPARPAYVGYYYPGTALSLSWKDPQAARPLAYTINGIPHRLAELQTNVTNDLEIRVQDAE